MINIMEKVGMAAMYIKAMNNKLIGNIPLNVYKGYVQ